MYLHADARAKPKVFVVATEQYLRTTIIRRNSLTEHRKRFGEIFFRLPAQSEETGHPSGDVLSPIGLTITFRIAINRDTPAGRFFKKPSRT